MLNQKMMPQNLFQIFHTNQTVITLRSRSVTNFLEIQKTLAEKSINLKILDLNLDISTQIEEMVLGVLAYIAQFEREIMLERQRVKISQAKSEGKFCGLQKK